MKSGQRLRQTQPWRLGSDTLVPLFLAFLCLTVSGPICHARDLPQLDPDPNSNMDSSQLLQPLVDTPTPSPGSTLAPLQGKAEKNGTIPVNDAGSSSQSMMITGKVQTLQEAIESEKDTVNWYAWYLAARAYLGRTGGLRCPLGTPIKFYKNGRIEAMSFDPYCIASVTGRRFLLPQNTKLEALILPVRPGQGPPASPEEINARVKSLQYK